jgi:enterochelin esterase family protein
VTWHYELGPDRHLGGSQLEVYETHPDSRERQDVPKGTVKQMPPWQSKIFEGTKRDWWVYVPAQYRPENPAAVMVFQDGAGPKDYIPTVFDNLIAKGDVPVMVGIFINPGIRADGGANRSFEYDTLSDQYARFLLEEILPEVEKTVKLRHDAASRAISGASSGGICSFTVAWERPNEFSKVLSWIGSFTNIAAGKTLREGGHNYEAMVRKTFPRKPIRVFLQDGGKRSRQRERELAAGQSDARQITRICRVRLQVRIRPWIPQQPSRPRDSPRFVAVALAGLQAVACSLRA